MFPGGDPFRMFAHMDQMMNQMFNDPFFGMPQQQMQQPPFQGYQQHAHTMPRVEEVPLDAAGTGNAGAAAAGPIVEEPDNAGRASSGGGAPQHYSNQQQRTYPNTQPQQHPQQQQPMQDPFVMQHMTPFGGLFGGMLGNMMGGMLGGMGGAGMVSAPAGQGPQVYSYSSSTVMRSGPDGTFHSSTTSRQAPGGVRETQQTIRDGRTGMESMTIARGMGEQERVVTRTRDANGQLITEEHHAGIDPSSAHEFDQQWTQRAQQTMPQWMQEHGSSSTQRIGPAGVQQQQQLALPSAGGAPQYGSQQQQQQQHYQQGGAGGYVQQQGAGHGGQQQQGGGRGGGVNGTGWPGGYHV